MVPWPLAGRACDAYTDQASTDDGLLRRLDARLGRQGVFLPLQVEARMSLNTTASSTERKAVYARLPAAGFLNGL